jgi:flagellar basal-body rod modification protein FlgD
MAGTSPLSQLPISSLVNINQPGSTGTSSSASSSSAVTSQLGPDAFLKLLTTQLANQDPLQPMDDTQSVAQLAQFSALQASDNLQSDFSKFSANFSVLQSSALLGKNVTVNTGTSSTGSNSSTEVGTVNSIQVTNGQPTFTLLDANGNQITDTNGNVLTFTTSQITGIGN